MEFALLELTFSDIQFELSALFNINMLSLLVAWILWLVILFQPLTGFDKRDRLTEAMYLFAILASGFIIVIGALYRLPHFQSVFSIVLAGIFMLATAHFRWKERKSLVKVPVPTEKPVRNKEP
jgi:hypothetical protein